MGVMPQYKGIYVKANGRWAARIMLNGQYKNLGVFDTSEEAARAYDAEASKVGKPLNFPEKPMPDVQIVEWHPYAKTFPLLEGDDYIDFRESIRNDGQDKPILARLHNRRVQGLDGQNRHRACLEIGTEPKIELVSVADDKVVDFIDRHNVLRRHMTREMRQARVNYLRSEGRSVRDIADRVGASPNTVQRDIAAQEDSGVPKSTPEKVTGLDGKSYPAAQPIDPAKLCPRCARNVRTGQKPVKACLDCRELKALANGREPGDDTLQEIADEREEKGKRKPGSVLYDLKEFNALWNKLNLQPDALRKAFGRPESPEIMGLLRRLGEFKKEFIDLLAIYKREHR